MMSNRRCGLLRLIFICIFSGTSAMFSEDAGILDFLISTTGHGPINMDVLTTLDESLFISYSPQSCYVACRAIESGHMEWRRNVCGTSTKYNPTETKPIVAATIAGHSVVTLDTTTPSAPILRCWDLVTGSLLWDIKTTALEKTHSLSSFKRDNIDYVVIRGSASGDLIINVSDGSVVHDISLSKAESLKHPSNILKSIACFDRTIEIETRNSIQVKRGVERRVSASSSTLQENIDGIVLLNCHKTAASVLLTSDRGTTSLVTVTGDSDKIEKHWTHEEGLAQISSALMLDASHEDIVKDNKKPDAAYLLGFQTRMQLQWNTLKKFFLSKEKRKDNDFGFVKVAVMVSESSHRVYGITTVGDVKSNVRYYFDLPTSSNWHRMIHGSVNTASGAHGINGRAHTREVLILSYTSDGLVLHWKCFDGANGVERSTGSIPLSSPVVQILPLSGDGRCRQDALLLLEDKSVMFVVDETSLHENLYGHYFDKSTSSMNTIAISETDSINKIIETQLVGSISFHGEDILSVSYPSREEIIASPCDIVGDDSLLLKYLNPHLAVVTTMTSSTVNVTDDFQLTSKAKTSQKRKPTGVTQDISDVLYKSEDNPNIFFNLVDTVSGRILYRASHANALPYPKPSVLVSENWVFYTFSNSKTRKAEIGVLTLYEGMIDKKSLTAFSHLEQLSTFSSLNARETKPVVLAKVFTIPNAVTTLGITSTRSGISSRRLLLAGIDGQIHSIDRKLLEPRRPLGPLKDVEKKEGLLQYHELIQTIPYLTLSYNQTVKDVRSIISAPTDLESQSLVLAFGGPDIFFTRTSPSKGFDLLPDNFNKPLLTIVVAALFVVLIIAQRLVSSKIRKQGWM